MWADSATQQVQLLGTRLQSGVHPHPHPRFAGDRGSTPIPIPDLPGIGDHPHDPRFPSGFRASALTETRRLGRPSPLGARCNNRAPCWQRRTTLNILVSRSGSLAKARRLRPQWRTPYSGEPGAAAPSGLEFEPALPERAPPYWPCFESAPAAASSVRWRWQSALTMVAPSTYAAPPRRRPDLTWHPERRLLSVPSAPQGPVAHGPGVLSQQCDMRQLPPTCSGPCQCDAGIVLFGQCGTA